MEYAKDIILNVKYKGREEVKNDFYRIKKIIGEIKILTKKCISLAIHTIKNNKMIFGIGSTLLVLIVADFVLIDRFLKLFLTLY